MRMYYGLTTFLTLFQGHCLDDKRELLKMISYGFLSLSKGRKATALGSVSKGRRESDKF